MRWPSASSPRHWSGWASPDPGWQSATDEAPAGGGSTLSPARGSGEAGRHARSLVLLVFLPARLRRSRLPHVEGRSLRRVVPAGPEEVGVPVAGQRIAAGLFVAVRSDRAF